MKRAASITLYQAIADGYCRNAEHELDRAVRDQFGDSEPTDEEDRLNAIYDAFDEGIEEAEADPGALASGPPAGIQEASRLALEYGFDDCGLDS